VDNRQRPADPVVCEPAQHIWAETSLAPEVTAGEEDYLQACGEDWGVEKDQRVKPGTLELIQALVNRSDLLNAAASAFRRAYPDAPKEMIEAAVFHVFCDGIWAALEWVAATERFLRDPSQGLDHGATCHVVYHLYNWQQFEALLPIGREGVLERLQDLKLLIGEKDPEAALHVLDQLEKSFRGQLKPPEIG
jgi:hypothetical protein